MEFKLHDDDTSPTFGGQYPTECRPGCRYRAAAVWAVAILDRVLDGWVGDDHDRATIRSVRGALHESENPRLRNRTP